MSIRLFIKVMGILEAGGFTAIVLWTWVEAFTHGGLIKVCVNCYGEMWGELALLIIIIPMVGFGLYYNLRDLLKEKASHAHARPLSYQREKIEVIK